jgi:hypothetical protein
MPTFSGEGDSVELDGIEIEDPSRTGDEDEEEDESDLLLNADGPDEREGFSYRVEVDQANVTAVAACHAVITVTAKLRARVGKTSSIGVSNGKGDSGGGDAGSGDGCKDADDTRDPQQTLLDDLDREVRRVQDATTHLLRCVQQMSEYQNTLSNHLAGVALRLSDEASFRAAFKMLFWAFGRCCRRPGGVKLFRRRRHKYSRVET